MREIERLARGQVFLDRRPYGDLGGVGEQILDNRRALARLLDLEQGRLAGTQPSATALSHVLEFLRWPTITLNPLSFRFSDWPGPCTPYPMTAIVSSLRVSSALLRGNSSRVITFSMTPPKFILP